MDTKPVDYNFPVKPKKDAVSNFDSDIVFGEVITRGGIARKMIVASEYKGKRSLKIMEMWKRDADDPKWEYGKKQVSFNYQSLKELIITLKRNKINSFDDLLLMFDPNDERE